MAASGLSDEYARAQNPVLSGIERRVATNSWIDAMGTDHDREIATVPILPIIAP